MAIIRTAKCTVCGKEQEESTYGAGWPGWIMVDGISIDEDIKVMVCPEDKPALADYIDVMKGGVKHGMDNA